MQVMGGQNFSGKLFLVLCLCNLYSVCATTDVCSNSILPGSKGDPGEVGTEGEEGKMGKTGPPGHRGLTGEYGEKGDMGRMGKMGSIGERGDKGQQGTDGPPGIKGKPVILGIRETEDTFYLLVKEARKFRESLLNCKMRGGSLAMPKTTETNTLLANYISEAHLTHVFIGLQVGEPEVGYMYIDGKPLLNTTIWGLQGPRSGNGDCVQLGSTGAWSQVECVATQYYICEFAKNRKSPATFM